MSAPGQPPSTPRAVRRALADYEAHLRRRGLAARTVATCLATARRFLGAAGRVRGLGRADVERFLAERSRALSQATLAAETSRVRALLRDLAKLGHLETSPADGLAVRRADGPPPLLLAPTAVARLLAAASAGHGRRDGPVPQAVRLRDRATIELAYGLGLRAAELRAALLVDLDLAAATLLVRRAKRGGQRVLPLPQAAVAHVRAWVERGRPVLTGARRAGRDAGHLLVGERGAPLRFQAVQKIVERVAARAGVRCHPHAFRRAVATHLVAEGVSVLAVQDLLGHERLDTTARYVDVDREGLRLAVEALERARG